jgi:hypothetical protein
MRSQDDKVVKLTLIVSGLAQNQDLLEMPTAEGGIMLDESEKSLLDLAVEITENIVPNFYDHNYQAFLVDFLRVLQSAAADGTGDVIDDVRYWLDSIANDGKLMVA